MIKIKKDSKHEEKINSFIPAAIAHARIVAGRVNLSSNEADKFKFDRAFHGKMDELAHKAGVRRCINLPNDMFGQDRKLQITNGQGMIATISEDIYKSIEWQR